VLSGDCAHLLVIDRKLQGITFRTPGPGERDVVLDTLLKKFGKPESAVPRTMQNIYGARYEAHNYAWSLGNVAVMYNDMEVSDPNTGQKYQSRFGRVLVHSRVLTDLLNAHEQKSPPKNEF
jgi:hypothetical protein